MLDMVLWHLYILNDKYLTIFPQINPCRNLKALFLMVANGRVTTGILKAQSRAFIVNKKKAL